MRPFGETQSKIMRADAQSRQYHTIVESRVRLTLITSQRGLSLSTKHNLYKIQTCSATHAR